MDLKDLTTDNVTIVLANPERSDWQCHLFGTQNEFVLRPLKGKEPNWFWRAMQFYAFGNRWVKVPK
jgi:hypothetical protein